MVTAPISVDVQADEVGIIGLRPPHLTVDSVHVEDGFALVADGRQWAMKFVTADGAQVGVAGVQYISAEEVEVVQVPGGPQVVRIDLVPQNA
uniref:hypothetical protein n=1 Tax=Nonomuraea sp. CA-251285 TaxID=3240002 RepID=UPI003F492C9C